MGGGLWVVVKWAINKWVGGMGCGVGGASGDAIAGSSAGSSAGASLGASAGARGFSRCLPRGAVDGHVRARVYCCRSARFVSHGTAHSSPLLAQIHFLRRRRHCNAHIVFFARVAQLSRKDAPCSRKDVSPGLRPPTVFSQGCVSHWWSPAHKASLGEQTAGGAAF